MSPRQITITPEQQAAMQERLTEVWAPFIDSMCVAAPHMAHAAARATEGLRRVAEPGVSPRP